MLILALYWLLDVIQFAVEICKTLVKLTVPSLRCLEMPTFAQLFCLLPDLPLPFQIVIYNLWIQYCFQFAICGPTAAFFALTTVFLPSEQVPPWNVVLARNFFDIMSWQNLLLEFKVVQNFSFFLFVETDLVESRRLWRSEFETEYSSSSKIYYYLGFLDDLFGITIFFV